MREGYTVSITARVKWRPLYLCTFCFLAGDIDSAIFLASSLPDLSDLDGQLRWEGRDPLAPLSPTSSVLSCPFFLVVIFGF